MLAVAPSVIGTVSSLPSTNEVDEKLVGTVDTRTELMFENTATDDKGTGVGGVDARLEIEASPLVALIIILSNDNLADIDIANVTGLDVSDKVAADTPISVSLLGLCKMSLFDVVTQGEEFRDTEVEIGGMTGLVFESAVGTLEDTILK